jgi:hypothetical protein
MTSRGWRLVARIGLSLLAVGCGEEVRATAAEGACEAKLGEATRLATVDWQRPALGAGHAYYVDDEAIVRVAVTGGEPETWTVGTEPTRLQVIGEHLYWQDADTLWRKPLSGGDVEAVFSAAELGAYDVRDGIVYWAHDRPVAPPEPSAPIDVHEGEVPIATLEGGGNSRGLFAEAGRLLVWNSRSSDPTPIHRLELLEPGGVVTRLASRQGRMDVAVSDGTVYWLGAELELPSPEQVLARDLDGAEDPRVAADATSLFGDDIWGAQLATVAADTERLYFAGFWSGEGGSQPLVVAQCHGGAEVATARIDGEPRYMAVDEDVVYVSGQDLYRIPIVR